MTKTSSKTLPARLRPRNRQQKEKQKWKRADAKPIRHTRIRRVSGQR